MIDVPVIGEGETAFGLWFTEQLGRVSGGGLACGESALRPFYGLWLWLKSCHGIERRIDSFTDAYRPRVAAFKHIALTSCGVGILSGLLFCARFREAKSAVRAIVSARWDGFPAKRAFHKDQTFL